MALDTLIDNIKAKMMHASNFDAKVKFDLGDDGVVFVDATQSPPEISEDDHGDADLTLISSLGVMEGIVDGSQDPNIAFMMGKLKVKGSMGLAMKLNSILED